MQERNMAPTIREVTMRNKHCKYAVDFFGDDVFVTVAQSPSVIRHGVCDVLHYNGNRYHRGRLVAGVCVQFTPVDTPVPPADILQICVGRRCIIVQLVCCSRVPKILRSFLEDKAITFVGYWTADYKGMLKATLLGLEIPRLLDIPCTVKCLRGATLDGLVKHLTGHEGPVLDDGTGFGDWTAEVLDHDQILLCCVEAYACFKVGVKEKMWLI